MSDEAPTNAPPYSVSDLAAALKRTIEDAFGHVRLRAEISKVTRHASGHVYLTLKDERASIDGVIWRGTVSRLAVQPEQGLEVVVTGKITTYAAGSRYQIIIDSMEAAGIGALLAQLERTKARLAGEGLFDASRKKPLPAMPAVIGVITSPTGAVIRDILHRIEERWPCRVVVWPVVVQGDQSPAQVRAAIEGFNAIPAGGEVPRPDLLIVARGGGSIEDLWAFNDEALARVVAASDIPLISAVGHETDTTLIDFVSDRRAPTPTAAAEIATPVLAELRAGLIGQHQRLARLGGSMIEERRVRLASAARGLPRPAELLSYAQQRLDLASGRLDPSLSRGVEAHGRDLARLEGRLKAGLARAGSATRDQERRLDELVQRMGRAVGQTLELAERRVAHAEQLRLASSPNRPLERGFARVWHDGHLMRSVEAMKSGEALSLEFIDGRRSATAGD
ncbi:MAG: exodeoxyribonuclease large subunit [Caulobacteraceae bacterium]|nr:exodeoxyribonuclease large subunit [Caulobacteraceae bacterium]